MFLLLVNNVAVHGIPDQRALQEGDIINIDVTVFLDGFHGDCSDTFPVGEVDEHAAKLMNVTRDCLGQLHYLLIICVCSLKSRIKEILFSNDSKYQFRLYLAFII